MKAKLILIGVGAAVVVAGLWFFLLWKPASNDLDNAKQDRAAAEQRADQLTVRLAHLRQLEKNADVLERDRQLLATAIPSKDELDQFILQVNERAARSGITFVSVSPQQPTVGAAAPAGAAQGGPTPVPLSLQVTGDYFKVLRFLDELRDGPRLLTVDSFALAKGAEGGVMTGTISARMFLNPTAAATSPVPAPTAG